MKSKINIIVFLLFIFGFFFVILFKKDTLISEDERRYLSTKEDLTLETFSSNLETYLLDQFPLRSNLRKVKSFSAYHIFNKLENNNVFNYDGSLIKVSTSYDYSKVDDVINKINKLRKIMFRKNNCYFVLVPDKINFYDKFTNMTPNYETIYNKINEKIYKTTMIDIKDSLNLSDYYITDTHWSQDKIKDISKIILESMGQIYEDISYETKEVKDFKGVLLSWSYSLGAKDDIKYLTNEELENIKVFNFETNKESSIYDFEKMNDEKSLDMYDLFLSGPTSLLKITNEKAISDKTLILFRDSFGSSIAPLLVHNYKNIYVVDIRYMDSSLLSNFIKVDGTEDVLFLYSTTLVEMPGNFKIN